MKVLIAGSSGLIGSAVSDELRQKAHEVVPLVRRTPRAGERQWDPGAGVLDPQVFEGIDAVISVGGAGIGDKRWSDERKRVIYDSRVDSTRLLAATMADLDVKPSVFVSASAIGVYGQRGDEVLTETSPPGDPEDDFLVRVVLAWEAATEPASSAGIRTVMSRTGLVLDEHGGALGRMLLPYKLGLGGRLGSGDQWWSWVTLHDVARALVFLTTSDLAGPVNLVAPSPVTNADFVTSLGRVLHRPTLIPVPRLALDVILGRELATALVFTSERVMPERLVEAGFTFEHEDVDGALESVLG